MHPPHRHWPRYLLGLTVLIALVASSTAYGVLTQFRCNLQGDCGGTPTGAGDSVPKPIDVPFLQKVKPGDPQTILLIGSDHRTATSADGDTGARSDTMMLVRLNGNQRPTTLLSIPRDTQVTVNGRTEKINEAFGDGGPKLAVQVVQELLGIPITHVAVIDFEAFQRAVNRLGCLYQDIDRSYFNNVTGPGGYAAIDVKSGYQLLCGGDTLSWVRFRHTDSDLVRGARQQAFLRSAKNQVAASKLIDDHTELMRIFRHYTQVDIHKTAALLTLIKLMLDSSSQPMRSVPFIASDSPDPAVNTNLLTTPAGIAKMRAAFVNPKLAKGPLAKQPKKAKKSKQARRAKTTHALAANLVKVDDSGRGDIAQASFDLSAKHLPVYVPTVRYAQGGWAERDPVRSYAIQAGRFSKKSYPAFRMTWSAGQGSMLGQYYGLQGTTWKNAPILKGMHHAVQRGGRTLQVYMAGGRPMLVAWFTPRAVYWVSNSISLSLTTSQLVDIAASLKRVAG